MDAEARRDGRRPVPGLELHDRVGELAPEDARDLALRRERHVGGKEQAVARGAPRRGPSSRARPRGAAPRPRRPRGRRASPASGRPAGTRRAPRRGRGRGARSSHAARSASLGGRGVDAVLGEEVDLLLEAAADDRVVAVEAGRHGLAHGDLLADVAVDEALQLLGRRRPLPRARETRPRGTRAARASRRCGRTTEPGAALPREDEEQRGPDREEVDERLAEEAFHVRSRIPEERRPDERRDASTEGSTERGGRAGSGVTSSRRPSARSSRWTRPRS